MNARLARFLSKTESENSELNRRIKQSNQKSSFQTRDPSKIFSRQATNRYLHGFSADNNHPLKLRMEGIAYKRLIKKEMLHQGQIQVFWSGAWNKKLLIQPDSLEHLSRFIEYRIEETQKLFSTINKPIEYNEDTVILWLFYQWLLIAKDKLQAPIPKHLPESIQQGFSQSIDLTKHIHTLSGDSSTKPKDAEPPKSSKNSSTEEKMKNQFSKILSEGLMVACLDEESQKVVFGRSPSNKQIEEFFTTANLLIEFGNHLGVWDLCFISSVAVPFHETNPFADENEWKRALRFEKTLNKIESIHHQHINDLKFLNERVIISLMVESYILDEQLLKTVLLTLNSPEQLQRIGKQIIIWVSPKGKSNQLVFISGLTELYYRQYLAACLKQGKPIQLDYRFPGASFYEKIGVSKHTLKLSTFKSWKHSIKTFLQLKGYLSGMGLAYVSGEVESHPFLPKVLNRLFNLNTAAKETSIHAENLSNHSRLPRSVLWSKLRSNLDVKHIKTSEEYYIRQGIKQRIKQIIKTPLFSENEALIARYALARIDKSYGFEALSPSTILGHIDAFGLPLILSAENQLLLTLPPIQRQVVYLNAMDIKGISSKRFLYYLQLFEQWLTKHQQSADATKRIEPIPDYEEIFADVTRPEFSVDASVMSFEEYKKIKEALHKAYMDTKCEKLAFLQATILLILGFKLDLRRSEAIFLETKDYVFDPKQPNLFIRPNKKRALKTNNARRMYHLEEHLSSDELEIFTTYIKTVEGKLKTQSFKYIFPDKITTICPTNRILTPLLQEIRRVTGDKEFKYHNLRHSKASWDMSAIFNAQFDLQLENSLFKHMPETSSFLAHARSHFTNAVHTKDSYHKAPFFLHRQMGHASLMTTLKNYIHTMDLVVAGLQQRHVKQKLTIEWASHLGVVKKSTLYKEKKQKNFAILAYLLEKACPWSILTATPNTKSDEEPLPTKEIESVDDSDTTIRSETLLPRQELQKWQAFSQFEVFHFFLQKDDERMQAALERISTETKAFDIINNIFKKNKWSRLKMPSHDAFFRRLIDEFLNLPDTWQQALLDNTFHTDTTFEHERNLISKTLNRMSIKAEGSDDPLALVKEIDIICNSPKEAKPVIEFIRLLGWQIQCHFMSPKIGNLSWLDWKTELELEDFEFNEESVVKTTINNSHGRMTIRLKRASISSKNRQIKHFEQYLLLSLLGLAIHM